MFIFFFTMKNKMMCNMNNMIVIVIICRVIIVKKWLNCLLSKSLEIGILVVNEHVYMYQKTEQCTYCIKDVFKRFSKNTIHVTL